MLAHACRDGDRMLGAPQAAPAQGCRLLESVFPHSLPLPHSMCPLTGSVSWRAGPLCSAHSCLDRNHHNPVRTRGPMWLWPSHPQGDSRQGVL